MIWLGMYVASYIFAHSLTSIMRACSDGLLITGERGLLYFDNGFGINPRLQDHYLKPYFTYKQQALVVLFSKKSI